MMHLRLGLFVTAIVTSLACSAGTTAQRIAPDGQSDPIVATRRTRALVKPVRRFAGYVPAAGRLTVIDQERETEAFGRDFGASVVAAVPVGRFDGVAALAKDGLTIVSDGAEQRFAFTLGSALWDASEEAPAFAFALSEGLRIIRHLGGETWQDETLPSPFGGGSSDVPLVSTDGTVVVLVRPSTGAYAIYRAPKAEAPMTLALACKEPPTLASSLVAFAFDGTRAYFGDRNGGLGIVDATLAACAPLAVSVSSDASGEVTRLVANGGEVLVTQTPGRMARWNVAAGSVASVSLSQCDFPLTPAPLANGEAAILCLKDVEKLTSDSVTYQSAAFHVYAANGGSPRLVRELDPNAFAAVALDAPTGRLFELTASALGRLRIVDLTSGATHERKGLFVDGVLAR